MLAWEGTFYPYEPFCLKADLLDLLLAVILATIFKTRKINYIIIKKTLRNLNNLTENN